MKTAIAIRHLAFEDLGSLAPLLESRGYTVSYLDATCERLTTPEVASADLLIVLGGPIGAFDDEIYPFVREEVAVIKQRLHAKLPLMGICLGAQFIARALGAQVASMGVKEIGFGPLTLTQAGQDSPLARLGDVPVLHWHGDRFEIPARATLLAGTPMCANQVFSVGRRVLALQCHLEADPATLERWLVGHACELGQQGIDPRKLRAEADKLRGVLPQAAQAVFGAWLDGLTSP